MEVFYRRFLYLRVPKEQGMRPKSMPTDHSLNSNGPEYGNAPDRKFKFIKLMRPTLVGPI